MEYRYRYTCTVSCYWFLFGEKTPIELKKYLHTGRSELKYIFLNLYIDVLLLLMSCKHVCIASGYWVHVLRVHVQNIYASLLLTRDWPIKIKQVL